MRSIYRLLFGLAGLVLLVGLASLWFARQPSGFEQFWQILKGELTLLVSVSPWRELSWVLLGGAAAGVVLYVLEVLLSIQRIRAAEQFKALAPENLRDAIKEVERRVKSSVEIGQPNVIVALDELIRGAITLAASDIHLTPGHDSARITYRVHGSLYDVVNISSDITPLLTTRIKVLARLDTYIRGVPQDGRLVMEMGGGSIEARVSTLPTETGERVVLRLVRGSQSVAELPSLGFSREVQNGLERILSRPQGLLFVTGPVGSGKTTTLYAAMKHISQTRGQTTTLVTLEDPIEMDLGFATQTQMNPKAGMTFASVLRSVLRQDPNVLMLGEIRDKETADIALQAGLTGHLLLTTVHGESAAGSFARIMDMEIEPFVLASATVGSLSQRLVRTLCTACRVESQPEPLQIDTFASAGVVLPGALYYESVGCPFCEGTGFTGRAPIAELLVVDADIRKAINERSTTANMEMLAVHNGMTPLLRDGLRRAMAGETSLAEVLRVAR